MKELIIILIVLTLFNCNQYEEIEVGSMYDYYFTNDIIVTNETEAINYVSNNISYKDESSDYWQLPEETYKLKTGDCEDFSLLLAYLFENQLNIRTSLILIGKGSQRHILVKYDSYYIDAIHGYIYNKLKPDWFIIYTMPYPETIWMTYYYHDNVGKYR